MPIQKNKLKDVHMYSSFPYIREVAKGVVSSSADQYGAHQINTSVAMPSSVTQFPAYVRAYVEHPAGVFSPVQGQDGLLVGWTNSRIYFNGYYAIGTWNVIFRIHYFVYDRLTI